MLEVAQLLTQSGPHVTLFQNRFDSESRLLFRAENNNSSAAFSLRLNCHLLQGAPVTRFMGIDETLAKEIVRRILSAASPDRIILFGSAASHSMTRDSDVDLLIVEQVPGNAHEESVRIRRLIGDIGYPVDVIVIGRDEISGRPRALAGGAMKFLEQGTGCWLR